MWCSECQLDVPALAVPEEPGVIRCAFCRCELSGKHEERHPDSDPRRDAGQPKGELETAIDDNDGESNLPVPRLVFVPPPPVDDWQADADLRQVERLVAVLRQSQGRSDVQASAGHAADWPALCDGSPAPNRGSAAGDEPGASSPPGDRTSLTAWCCLTLGLMAFVCGGVLVIWSFAADRGDLWSLGLPLTLAGQVGLVLGLLLQLDGMSQSNLRTERTLNELDGQLGQLRSVTAMINTTRSGPAHSFYAHLTEGAAPQILLADLKGQLDLLAQQMARQRRAA